MKCSICEGEVDIQKNSEGKVIWDQGHNAQPINDGRCCTKCNEEKVIPARLKR